KEDSYESYINDPSEVHSRIMQLRQLNNLKPNEFLNKEDVKELKGVDKLELDHMSTEQLMNILNQTVYAEPNRQDTHYAQQGGQIPSTPLGQYQYPNQVVNVPTPNGSITMQGVDYPVLGISQETGERQVMF